MSARHCICSNGIIRDRYRASATSGPMAGRWIVGTCDRCNSFDLTPVEDEQRPAPAVADMRPASPPTPVVSWTGGFDDLRQVPSAWFVPALTGRERVGRYVQCPLHDDDRPSLHVSDQDASWFCHGCSRGGGLPEFYCAIHDRSVPTDRNEFKRLVCEITDVLGRA
jgi:hypothetical protein